MQRVEVKTGIKGALARNKGVRPSAMMITGHSEPEP